MAAYSNLQIANYLRFDFWEWAADAGDLSFDRTNLTVDVSGISAPARAMARQALRHYEDATGLSFAEKRGGADITFAEPSGAVARTSFGGIYANGDGSYRIANARVEIGAEWLEVNGTGPGSYGYQTYVHEIGHALGLGHAGPYNGGATWGTDNRYENDSWQASVMSYFSQPQNPNVTATFAYVMTPQVADLIALQDMYGAGNGRAGDTVYGYGASPGAGVYDAGRYAGNVSYTIWDAGGTDTLNYSRSRTNDRIDLRPSAENGAGVYASSVWGEVGNVAIAPRVVIENAIGGDGHNRIIGNGADNRLEGRGGNDYLASGGGNDRLYGGPGDDRLNGGGGRDRLYGDDGDDEVDGGAGDDVIAGGAGSDQLDGGGGNDWLIGGPGADRLAGSTGIDRAAYVDTTGVRVDLAQPEINTGYAAGDVFVSIEGLVGSRYRDVLRGDNGDNELLGAPGVDVLSGRGGGDFIAGGSNADRLYGDSGNDRLYGGAGNDELHGDVGNDRLYGDRDHDRVYGGDGNDFVAGGSGNDRLEGGAGVDLFFGGPGSDSFVFGRGSERDKVADFAPGADTLLIDDDLWDGFLTPGDVIDSFATLVGGDTLFDFGGGDNFTLLGVATLDLEDDILIV